MINKQDLQAFIHQHCIQLMCAGIPHAKALHLACSVACSIYDDASFRRALNDAANTLGVDPVLAKLPDHVEDSGGATAALSPEYHDSA